MLNIFTDLNAVSEKRQEYQDYMDKLMEFDYKLYAMAKSAGAMAKLKDGKEHKSLWEDEEKKENIDAEEAADNVEAFADGPELVDVAEVMDTETT